MQEIDPARYHFPHGSQFCNLLMLKMLWTGRFELPTPRTPGDFRTIDADCCLLDFTTVISLHASCNRTELLLMYAMVKLAGQNQQIIKGTASN
jgi:hypothetical protein